MTSPSAFCTVGLTGGLASGKSTVGRLLVERGIALFDCDRCVHELYRPGGAGATAVVELFGSGVLAADGGVDRDALAAWVIGNGDALERLNAAIHPLVRGGVAQWLEELARSGDDSPAVAVVEAALLVETGSSRDYDVLVLVWCRPEQQLERAVGRGLDKQRARALMASQTALDRKLVHADVVIDNSGGREALEAEVERAWQRILSLCRARRSDSVTE